MRIGSLFWCQYGTFALLIVGGVAPAHKWAVRLCAIVYFYAFLGNAIDGPVMWLYGLAPTGSLWKSAFSIDICVDLVAQVGKLVAIPHQAHAAIVVIKFIIGPIENKYLFRKNNIVVGCFSSGQYFVNIFESCARGFKLQKKFFMMHAKPVRLSPFQK